MTGLWHRGPDHFEPNDDLDPKAQQRLRGHLEQIDYTAYAANRKVLSKAIGGADLEKFEHLGAATALARTQWVAAALAVTQGGHIPTPEQVEKLGELRAAYHELTEVYDALRRMVERGYLTYEASEASSRSA